MEQITDGIILACKIFSTVFGALYLFRAIYVIIGFFKVKHYPTAAEKRRLAILIPARNESAVIGKLLESIYAQDYPKDKFSVFVVADNCTDGGSTAAISRQHGAVCFERFDDSRRTKGFALEYLFDKIEANYGISSFDAYLIFDADNLLSSDYLTKMNDALDGGEDIVVSCRMSKNFFDNWISFSYGIHWLSTVWAEHRARSVLGVSTRIQGTGYMFTSRVVADGWHYTSLTEDREFAAEATLRGYRIGYCNDAVFYDEQPVSLKIALRQRLRWSKGHIHVFKAKAGKLFRRIFRHPFSKDSFNFYDMLLITTPESIVYIVLDTVVLIASLFSPLRAELLITWLTGRLTSYLTKCLPAVYVFLRERRRIPNISPLMVVPYILLFPLFYIIGRITLIAAIFLKVEWKPIPHTRQINISSINEKRHK